MSKYFRPWKIDQPQLLPPSVQDFVPRDYLELDNTVAQPSFPPTLT
jgi:hypothetical protein